MSTSLIETFRVYASAAFNPDDWSAVYAYTSDPVPGRLHMGKAHYRCEQTHLCSPGDEAPHLAVTPRWTIP